MGTLFAQHHGHGQGEDEQMTGQEFLQELKEQLDFLTAQQRQEVMSYFEECVADIGDEEAAIAELGTPKAVAQELRQSFQDQELLQDNQSEEESFSSVQHLVGDSRSVTIKLTSLDVEVEQASVEQVTVELSDGLEEAVKVNHIDGCLDIRQQVISNGNKWSWLDRITLSFALSGTVRVLVPEELELDAVTITSSRGDVKLSQVRARKLQAHLSCGDLSLVDSEIEAATLTLLCGDFDLQDNRLETLEVYGKAGNFNLGDSQLRQLTVDLSCGDVSVTDSKLSDFTVHLSCGDLSLDTSALDRLTARLSCGDVEMSQTLVRETSHLQLAMGDASVGWPSDKQELATLDMKTSLGDLDLTRQGQSVPIRGNHYQSGQTGQTPTLTITNTCGDIEVSL